MPGVTYAIGFVRTYADYLGLDGDALVARFKSESAAWRAPRPLTLPETRPERTFPGAAVIALSGVLIAVVFGAWVTWRDQPAQVAVTVGAPPGLVAEQAPAAAAPADAKPVPDLPQVAAVVAPPVGGIEIPIVPAGDTAAPVAVAPDVAAAADPVPVAPPESAPPPAAPPVVAAPAIVAAVPDPVPFPTVVTPPPSIVPSAAQLAAPAPLPVIPPPADPVARQSRPGTISAVAAEPGVAALPAVPGVDAAVSGPGREYGRANRDARVILRATAESWIQVRDTRQNVVLTRMLQPGDSYRVPNRPDLTLLTGNAGGLEITVDGVAIPALGPAGAVRRDVPLIPDSLRGAN